LVLEGQTGIRAVQFMNVYLDIPLGMVYGIVAILVVFIVFFMATAYFALNRRYSFDLPEGIAEHAR
jgi:hypothetical protein